MRTQESPIDFASLVVVVALCIAVLAAGCTAAGDASFGEPSAAHPRWSPDGASIAYVVWHQRDTSSIKIDFRGTARIIDVARRRDRALFEGSGWHPQIAWSPDGRWLALPSDRDRRRGTSCFEPPCDVLPELYVVRRDGKKGRRLTNNRANDFGPAWSPDGRRLAFISGRDRPPGVRTWRDVYVMSIESGTITRITNDLTWELAVRWVGRRQLEITREDATRYVIAADPVGGIRRSHASRPEPGNFVAPRSRAVAWLSRSDRNGETCFQDSDDETCEPNAEVYLQTPAGRRMRITRTTTDEHDLAWSADGRWLAS